jgi:nicotinamidase-related amidase
MSDWRLTPLNSALVVVDVQEKLMRLMPHRADVIAGIQKLIRAARVLKVPALITAQYVKGLGPVCAEVMESAPGVTVFEKLTFSCCGSMEFMRALKDLGRQRILLCGIETHVCIQQTAIDLMKDFFVYIAADAVGSRHEADYSFAVERLRDCGAVVTTVESAVFELVRESGTEAFKQILPLFRG